MMALQPMESRAAASARDELIAAIASTADEAQKLTYRLFLAIYDDLRRSLDALHEDEAHRADHELISIIRKEREDAATDAKADKRAARDAAIRQVVTVAISVAAGAIGVLMAIK